MVVSVAVSASSLINIIMINEIVTTSPTFISSSVMGTCHMGIARLVTLSSGIHIMTGYKLGMFYIVKCRVKVR